MAKDKKSTGIKDLGTVKEVHCSGVAITSTGVKIFMANVTKGDRIIEEDGKRKIAPKPESKPADNKPAIQTTNKQVSAGKLNTQAGADGFLEEEGNTQINGKDSPGGNDGENLLKAGE